MKQLAVLLTFGLGQTLALCLASCNIINGILYNEHGFNMPSTQAALWYFVLLLSYGSFLLFRTIKRTKSDSDLIEDSHFIYQWRVMLFLSVNALFDFQANFLVLLAFSYIPVTHVILLLCLTTPSVMLISYFAFKTRYRWQQYLGLFVSVASTAAFVIRGLILEGNTLEQVQPQSRIIGYVVCLIGAVLYAVSNCMQEYCVLRGGLVNYLTSIGFFGTIFAAIQASIIDHRTWFNFYWKTQVVSYLLGSFSVLLLFYSLTPVMIRRSSAASLNLSLLTSNLWTVCLTLVFGLPCDDIVDPIYVSMFILIIAGLLMFHAVDYRMATRKAD